MTDIKDRRTWLNLGERRRRTAAEQARQAAELGSDAAERARKAVEQGRQAARRGRAAADRAREQARQFDPGDLAIVAKPLADTAADLAEGVAGTVGSMPARLRDLAEDLPRIRSENIRESAERIAATTLQRRSASRAPIALAMLLAAGVGALLGYLLDPDRGRTRRAVAADRLAAFGRRAGRVGEGWAHELRGQLTGLQAEVRRGSGTIGPFDDVTLAHKVESELFRDPSVPKTRMNVNAENGVVILRGRVDTIDQIEQIMAATLAIDGVRTVRSLLRTPDDQLPWTDGRELVRTRSGS